MKITTTNQIAIGLVLGLAASASYALPTTFDFRGTPYSEAASYAFTVDGITLTAEAYKQAGSLEMVTQNINGLGVCADPQETSCATMNSESQIDSIGPNEELHFAISGLNPGEGLALDGLFFESYSMNANQDRFRMWIDGIELPGPSIKPSGAYLGGGQLDWDIESDFGLLVAYDSFWIRAVPSNMVQAQFRIASFTGHTVPEPTSLALLGLGLVGMGVARRKRKV